MTEDNIKTMVPVFKMKDVEISTERIARMIEEGHDLIEINGIIYLPIAVANKDGEYH